MYYSKIDKGRLKLLQNTRELRQFVYIKAENYTVIFIPVDLNCEQPFCTHMTRF